MTEKITWGAADERLLQTLQERKRFFDEQKRTAVQKVVGDLYYCSMSFYDLVDALIENAESIRDALEPYDSGVRPAKVED
jgi:hypothetical protein